MPNTPHRAETEFEHVEALLAHLRLSWLLRRFPARLVRAAYVMVNGFITIALLSAVAAATHSAFIFPSLGPTAYLLFFSPMAPSSSPRHAILGHGIGLLCGYAAFAITGLSRQPVYAHPGLFWPGVMAAAFSLAATGALMVLFGVSHAPAGATTLIVSLGIICRPVELLIIEAAVFLLVAQALAINRLAGLAYPLWSEVRDPAGPRMG